MRSTLVSAGIYTSETQKGFSMYVHPLAVLILLALAVIFGLKWLGVSLLTGVLCAIIVALITVIIMFLSNFKVYR